MSWDVILENNDDFSEIDVCNYSYNVSPMFKKAGLNFVELNERNATEVSRILTDVIIRMTEKPNDYRELNPSNGWGTYEGAIGFLAKIIKQCLLYPQYSVKIT